MGNKFFRSCADLPITIHRALQRNCTYPEVSSLYTKSHSFVTVLNGKHDIHSDLLIVVMEYLSISDIGQTVACINSEFLYFVLHNPVLWKMLLERDFYTNKILKKTWKRSYLEFPEIRSRLFKVLKELALFKHLDNKTVMKLAFLAKKEQTDKTMTLCETQEKPLELYFLMKGVFINNGTKTYVGRNMEKGAIPLKFTKEPPVGHVWAKAAKNKKTLYNLKKSDMMRVFREFCSKEEKTRLEKMFDGKICLLSKSEYDDFVYKNRLITFPKYARQARLV